MSTFSFLKEGLKNLRTTGTITRSSPSLCRAAIEGINFQEAKVIVELGAGDGVITRHILRQLRPDGMVLAFEVAADLCEDMRAIGDPRLIVVQDSAEQIQAYLQAHQLGQADAVVSAIPFAILPPAVGKKIVAAAHDCLKPAGRYQQLHYSLKTKNYYREAFGNVHTRWVPWNLPPAFVLSCVKQPAR